MEITQSIKDIMYLYQEGFTPEKISEELNLPLSFILNVLENKERKVLELYSSGVKVREIADTLKMSTATIYQLLRASNIPLRNKGVSKAKIEHVLNILREYYLKKNHRNLALYYVHKLGLKGFRQLYNEGLNPQQYYEKIASEIKEMYEN